MLKMIPKPRRRALVPIPAMERRRQVLRPNRSGSGAQAMVTTRLTAPTATVMRPAAVGRMDERMETEYMTTLLTPQSCWASMTPMTATMALLWSGWAMTLNMPMGSIVEGGFLGGERGRSEELRRREASSSVGGVSNGY